MDYPERRTIKWVDDKTGEVTGECEYVRFDIVNRAWQEGYDDCMEDIQFMENTTNPYIGTVRK